MLVNFIYNAVIARMATGDGYHRVSGFSSTFTSCIRNLYYRESMWRVHNYDERLIRYTSHRKEIITAINRSKCTLTNSQISFLLSEHLPTNLKDEDSNYLFSYFIRKFFSVDGDCKQFTQLITGLSIATLRCIIPNTMLRRYSCSREEILLKYLKYFFKLNPNINLENKLPSPTIF